MPKVNPFAGTLDFVEGEKITKDAFRNFKAKIDAVESVVDQDNIRQEGLDRRSFGTQTWHKPLDSSNTRAYIDEAPISLDPLVTDSPSDWKMVRADTTGTIIKSPDFAGGRMMVGCAFNPEIDSHIIVRCSGVVSTRQKYYVQSDNHFIDIGLRVRHADETGEVVTRYEREYSEWKKGVVWPYQRISLNTAYTELAEQGFRRHVNDFRGYTLNTDGSFLAHLPGTAAEDKGHATEWMYDRKTYMHYNFHLLHHISSDANAGLAHLLQETPAATPTTPIDLRFEIMYRSTSAGTVGGFVRSDHLTDRSLSEMSSMGYAKLSDCMLSVQVIRR